MSATVHSFPADRIVHNKVGPGRVVLFPRPHGHALPPDAIPRGRDRHVIVFPENGSWSLLESDEGGGTYIGGISKRDAICQANEWVLEFRATLDVRNLPLFEDGC